MLQLLRFIQCLLCGWPCRICGDWPCRTVHFHATRDEQGQPLKLRPYPGPWAIDADPFDREAFNVAIIERNRRIDEWDRAERERASGMPVGQ